MKRAKLLVLSLLLCACIHHNNDKEYELSIVLDAVDHRMNLLILDTDNNVVPSANVTFQGDFSNQIATSEGRISDFTAVDGVFSFGVLSNYSTSFDTSNPENMEMIIEASGYEVKSQEITFDGTDQSEVFVIVLQKEGEEVEGVTEEVKEEDLEKGKITAEIEVVTETTQNKTLLTISEETSFVDVKGELVEAEEIKIVTQAFERQFDYDGVAFHSSNQTLFSFFPEGTFNDTDGENGYLIPLAPVYHFSFETSSGNNVEELTENVTIRTYLTIANEINPATGSLLSVGDFVDVYTSKNLANDFVKIPSAEIKYDGAIGQNYIEFETSQTGYYEFGFTVGNTNSCSSFDEIVLRNEGKSASYILMAVTQQGTTVGGVSLTLTGDNFINGASLNRFKALSPLFSSGLSLVVLAYNDDANQFEEVYDESNSFCELNNQIIYIGNSECSEVYDLDLNLSCDGVTILTDDLPVYYKEKDALEFELFQYIKNGFIKGNGPCLKDGKSYVFKVFFDGENRISQSVTGARIDELYLEFDEEQFCERLNEEIDNF